MSKTQDCFPEDGYLPNYWSTWPFAGTLFWSDIRVLFLPCSRPLTSNRGAPLLTPKPCSQERAAHPNVFSVWLWIVSTVPFLGGGLWRLLPSGTITWDIYDLSAFFASAAHLLLFFSFLFSQSVFTKSSFHSGNYALRSTCDCRPLTLT